MTTITNMSDEQKEERKKCNRCKVNLLLKDFIIKRSGEYAKQCNHCAEYAKQHREKSKCPHKRRKDRCVECEGMGLCLHKKQKAQCKECDGSTYCIHKKHKAYCRECGGSAYCIHKKIRSVCRECEGSSICIHKKVRSVCKECGGGSICIHNKNRSVCKECEGSAYCIHKKQKTQCRECDICGYIRSVTKNRIYKALNGNKENHTIEYLGCTIKVFKEHIEKQFTEGMTWENHGEWHIDHIIPIKYENPTLEEVIQRLHWKNTQPLWAEDNIAKGNRFIGKKEDHV
jgi:hypothetical protein